MAFNMQYINYHEFSILPSLRLPKLYVMSILKYTVTEESSTPSIHHERPPTEHLTSPNLPQSLPLPSSSTHITPIPEILTSFPSQPYSHRWCAAPDSGSHAARRARPDPARPHRSPRAGRWPAPGTAAGSSAGRAAACWRAAAAAPSPAG